MATPLSIRVVQTAVGMPQDGEIEVHKSAAGEATDGSERLVAPVIFISYSSPDVAVADRVCGVLEAAGLRCWIAPRNVMAGEFYAEAIVQGIDGAKLLVVVLSENAIASPSVLREIERASAKRRPLVSLRLDHSVLPAAMEYFLNSSQWLDASTVGVERALPQLLTSVQRLLETPASAPSARGNVVRSVGIVLSDAGPDGGPVGRRRRAPLITTIALLGLSLSYGALNYFWLAKRNTDEKLVSTTPLPAPVFNPPAHSVAVLPFVNISGDKEQEYFSDGLTEEVLNSLSRIPELQVAARTSAFSFKGKDSDVATVARKLNVGAVLEGSVRRSAHTVRINAQLIDALTGFRVWSQTYDRELGDVLKLQTDIANAVRSALKVTLLRDVVAEIELGGTHNPAAFDAYLRGLQAFLKLEQESEQTAILEYTEAVHLDPNYALAYARRARALYGYAMEYETDPSAQNAGFAKALVDARRAIRLAPELAEGHQALAGVLYSGFLDFRHALEEFERAVALAPGNALVLTDYGRFAVFMGRTREGLAAARRAVIVDPLNPLTQSHLGEALVGAHRFEEALAAFQEFLVLDPTDPSAYALSGLAHYELGNFESARMSCEEKPDYWASQLCLVMTYEKLGRHADSEIMLTRMRASLGDEVPYLFSEIYAQRGNIAKALESLDRALRSREPSLQRLRTDRLLDPLRQEPRFQAVERTLKFPS